MSDDYEENQMRLYSCELLKTISETAPRLYDTMNSKNRQKIIEVLIDNMIDNLITYGKIRILLGKDGSRFSQEELDNIRINLLALVK